MSNPDHWSYSQWDEFRQCGHRYRLRRVDGHPGVPSVASVAGKAWHKWTELYDLGAWEPEILVDGWDACLDEAIGQEEMRSGMAPDTWRVSGRATKAAPNKEDLDHWRVYGWELCEKYITWAASTPWTIARDLPPDKEGRRHGIEYGMNVTVGGEDFVAYLDRITTDENGNLGVVDYKTGSQLRHSIQLGMYAAAAAQHGITLHWGAIYQARKGVSTVPVPLTGWSPQRMERIMAPQIFLRENAVYPITPGEHCAWCPVRDHCEYHL